MGKTIEDAIAARQMAESARESGHKQAEEVLAKLKKKYPESPTYRDHPATQKAYKKAAEPWHAASNRSVHAATLKDQAGKDIIEAVDSLGVAKEHLNKETERGQHKPAVGGVKDHNHSGS